MPEDQTRFQEAIGRFDAANAEDPHQSAGVAAELLYAQRMTQWLDKLYPDAGEALKLAARAQHIRRWTIARSQYPMTRAGYHEWRIALYGFHADTAAAILQEVGYDAATINRVRSLLKKEKLKIDPQTQALEDVACLVFLENYFADFAHKHDEQKIVGILKRTWSKMSPKGRAAALELQLQLPESSRRLIAKALG
jgi:phage terminase large subunit-like protein